MEPVTMELGILTSVFNVLSVYMPTVYGYTTGILFAWSLSLLVDYFHLKRLTSKLQTKAKNNPDTPALTVLLTTFMVNLALAAYVFIVPNHLPFEMLGAIQFWLCVGLLRTTEIIYKSLLFIAPTSTQVLNTYSWRYLFHP